MLPEHANPKAARILGAARELLSIRGVRGVTVAEVASRAYVGKGTVYLFWPTKEDLLIGLLGREMLAVVDTLIAELSDDPLLAHPTELCPLVVRTTQSRPLVAALDDRDRDVLGILIDDLRSRRLWDALGPLALLQMVVPVWRELRMVERDSPVAEQIVTLHALTVGTVDTMRRPHPQLDVDPMRAYIRGVSALLKARPTDRASTDRAARSIIAALGTAHSQAVTVLEAMSTSTADTGLSMASPDPVSRSGGIRD